MENAILPQDDKTTKHIGDYADVLHFCSTYNESEPMPKDEFIDGFCKNCTETAVTIATICNVSLAELNLDAVLSQPLLRICIILDGNAFGSGRVYPTRMKRIAGILLDMDPATMSVAVNPALYDALSFNIYIQWRLIYFPKTTHTRARRAWGEWVNGRDQLFTTQGAVDMLFSLLHDAVTVPQPTL